MNEPSQPHQFYQYLRKVCISTLIIFIITFVQLYWSVGALAHQMSSACLECSFFEDAVLMSLVSAILISGIIALAFFIKNIYAKALVEFTTLTIVWTFMNYSVFVDREASWSTYDFNAEIQYTLSVSMVPVIILGCVCIFLLRYKK
ncbi:hypothetical protein [Chryseobacterium pennipullorum]|nr:hypothetical protein [Chryseobacterium pennipullorum]